MNGVYRMIYYKYCRRQKIKLSEIPLGYKLNFFVYTMDGVLQPEQKNYNSIGLPDLSNILNVYYYLGFLDKSNQKVQGKELTLTNIYAQVSNSNKIADNLKITIN